MNVDVGAEFDLLDRDPGFFLAGLAGLLKQLSLLGQELLDALHEFVVVGRHGERRAVADLVDLDGHVFMRQEPQRCTAELGQATQGHVAGH